MSDPVQKVLQSLVTHLVNDKVMGWQLESYVLKSNAMSRPFLTAETVMLGHEIRLCARVWGDNQFRVAMRISHGLNKSTAPDGRRAPPEHQREPNVVTPVHLMSMKSAEEWADGARWESMVKMLLGKGYKDLNALADDLLRILTSIDVATPKQP
jgi:hypothetical protein